MRWRTVVALLLTVLMTACGASPPSPPSPVETTAALQTTAIPETTEAAETLPLLGAEAKILWENDGVAYTLTPDSPPNDGILFVDHQAKRRSGHMGHAMVEYAPGKLLCFYPNCNAENDGHSGRGWMEYRRSTDGGATFGEPIKLTHSEQVFLESDQTRSVMCEKAILSPDGSRIILFCLNCDVKKNALWEPYFPITYLVSEDEGETWSEPRPLGQGSGRVWDVMADEKSIYVLASDRGEFRFYVSDDGGDSFAERAKLSFNRSGSYYGTMNRLPDGRIIAYTYNESDETKLEYVVSNDPYGYTWGYPAYADFAKCIRNPQLACLEGSYFLVGRSGSLNRGEAQGNFILYCSTDGRSWDEGRYLRMREAGTGAYSNTLVVGGRWDDVPDRLLIQTSHAYYLSQTNILHWWIDAYSTEHESKKG